jgi:hypothetical protein
VQSSGFGNFGVYEAKKSQYLKGIRLYDQNKAGVMFKIHSVLILFHHFRILKVLTNFAAVHQLNTSLKHYVDSLVCLNKLVDYSYYCIASTGNKIILLICKTEKLRSLSREEDNKPI